MSVKKDRLIIGIDPGMVVGYAILNFQKQLLAIGSARQLTLDKLISIILGYGKPLIISCDVKQTPKLVSKLASAFDAIIIKPVECLSMKKKYKLVKEFFKQEKKESLFSNKHELCALASAVYAYKHVSNLINRIKNKLNVSGNMIGYVVEQVLLKKKKFSSLNFLT